MSNNENQNSLYMLNKLENKVDKLDEKLDSIDKTLIKQEQNLSEHMRRTQINEEQLKLFEKSLSPVVEHVAFLKFLGKLGGYVAGFVTFLATSLGIYVLFR